MTDRPVEPAGSSARPETCAHPWLRIVCGECGEPVDMLRRDVICPPVLNVDIPLASPDSAEPVGDIPGTGPSADDRGSIFVVARGHPELVEQLRAAMGHSVDIRIIEDRRRAPRDPGSPEDSAPVGREELRKRVLEDELADSGHDPGAAR